MFAPSASAASASAQMRVDGVLERRRARRRPARSCRACGRGRRRCRPGAARSSSVVEQDRVVDHELARVLGRLVEQVPLGADARLHAHHDRLADRVDRRVGHLREELLEVGVEQRLPVGEHGERQVVPHRADRLLGVPRERREDHLHVLLRVAERELALAQRLGGTREVRPRAADPRAGRPRLDTTRRTAAASRPSRLTSSSGTIRPCSRSTRKSLPGCSRPLRRTFSRRLVEHARLRREHDPAVLASRASGRGAGRCGRASRRSRGRP